MAKQIIVLERTGEPSDYNFKVIFWLTIPATRQSFYTNSIAISAFKNATAEEIQAIQTGQIKEVAIFCSYPTGTTLAAITTDLISKFNTEQIILNTQNPFIRYGTYWDGISWINQGVI